MTFIRVFPLAIQSTQWRVEMKLNPSLAKHEEANWSGSALFVIKYVNFYQKLWSSNLIGWKLEVGLAS